MNYICGYSSLTKRRKTKRKIKISHPGTKEFFNTSKSKTGNPYLYESIFLMKYILVLLVIAPCFVNARVAHSQDTAKLECKLIKATDPYTKEKTISSGFIGMEGASLTIDATKQEVDMLFTVSGSDKCYTDASTAAIFFVGTKVKLTQRNNGAMNCEGIFRFTFRNTTLAPATLRRLASQKVEKIIFIGNNKKESIVTLTPEQQDLLMKLSACMMNEAPTLLQ